MTCTCSDCRTVRRRMQERERRELNLIAAGVLALGLALAALMLLAPERARGDDGIHGRAPVLTAPLATAGNLPPAGLTCAPSMVCTPAAAGGTLSCTDANGVAMSVGGGTGTTEDSPFVPTAGGSARKQLRVVAAGNSPTIASANHALGTLWSGQHTVILAASVAAAGGVAFDQLEDAVGGQAGMIVRIDSGGNLICRYDGGGVSQEPTIAGAMGGGWAVAACGFDGTNYTLFVNGATGSAARTVTSGDASAYDVRFGSFGGSGGSQPINGPLGFVAVYGCHLTTGEKNRIAAGWFGGVAEGRSITVDRNSLGWDRSAAGVLYAVAQDGPRVTPWCGLRSEPARTNRVTHSFDLSNAAWTKANTTATLTATGLDGLANSASIVTATAGNGTAILSRAGLASTARVGSVYVRRRTGSGVVELTCDGGGTWTAIVPPAAWDTDPSNGEADRFTCTRAADTAVDFGLRLATNGDAVDVDCAQVEEGENATTCIRCSTAECSRAAELPSATTTGLPTREGELELTVEPAWATTDGSRVLLDTRTAGAGAGLQLLIDSSERLALVTASAGASTTTQSAALVWAPGTAYRVRARWGQGAAVVYRDGSQVAVTASGGTMPTAHSGGSLFVGSQGGATLEALGCVRHVEVRQ